MANKETYTRSGRREAGEIDYGRPVLRRYADAVALRNATNAELIDSRAAAESDGGAGVIDVAGESCYVEE